MREQRKSLHGEVRRGEGYLQIFYVKRDRIETIFSDAIVRIGPKFILDPNLELN